MKLSWLAMESALPSPDKTSASRAPLRSVAVFGGGTTALLAACALARALPGAAITRVRTPVSSDALCDAAHTALPGFAAFNERLGLGEHQLLLNAAATHRLATRFRDWRTDAKPWVAGYGAAGYPETSGRFIGTGSSSLGRSPAEAGPAAAIALLGRFVTPGDTPDTVLSDIDYALRVDPERYRTGLEALSRHLAVPSSPGEPVAARRDAAGSIVAVALADGELVEADLFIDATGPAARISALLDFGERIDWSDMLPVDRLILPEQADRPALSPMDEIVALSEGWLAVSPGRDATRMIFAHHSSTATDIAADALHRATGAKAAMPIKLTPGRLREPFRHNCIAIGDAAAEFEPLGWLNLTFAIRSIELLVELLPARTIDPLERAEYNRRWSLTADRARDFVAAHYSAPTRHHSPFWSRAENLDRSPTLNHTLSEFRRRSRLPHHEDDIVPADFWRAVLAGSGVPSTPSPVDIARSDDQHRAIRRDHEQRIAEAIAATERYPQWLERELARAH